MQEKARIIIKYQGKEVKKEQLKCYRGQQGERIFDLPRKSCKIILHSAGEKNVIVVTDQHGKINWCGTYGLNITLQCIDLVMFKEEFMKRFNCVSVVDLANNRYQVPVFNYFENELVAEDMGEAMPTVLETEEIQKEVEVTETEHESMVETPEEPVIEPETEDRNALIAKNITEFCSRSGLSE